MADVDLRLDAFHLPAISHPPVTTWSYGDSGRTRIELRIARLTPELLSRQIDALLAAREAGLESRSAHEIAAVIGRVADRLLDGSDELRRTAARALEVVVGLSPEMVAVVIERMADGWRVESLQRLLSAEFGDTGALDRFASRPDTGSRSRAFGPELAVHVFSGNVPGVAVTSLVRSLLVKAATLGKTAAGEPILAALFARALAEEDPALGACVAVTYWPGGDEALERCALERAGAVIAYGGHGAITSLRARTPPEVAFLGYGHRVSFGVLARESLAGRTAERLADDAALAVATFDQQGCVSPHLFYVEDGGHFSAVEWAEQLAAALERLEPRLPRGALSPGEIAAIRQARGEAEIGQLAGHGHVLHASASGTSWTVIHDPDPTFSPSCLNRVVRVKPVASIRDVGALVRPIGPVLQTVGVAGSPERIAELAAVLGRLGASRITTLARMAWPPPEWHHDGRPPLRDLVRWCDWEP